MKHVLISGSTGDDIRDLREDIASANAELVDLLLLGKMWTSMWALPRPKHMTNQQTELQLALKRWAQSDCRAVIGRWQTRTDEVWQTFGLKVIFTCRELWPSAYHPRKSWGLGSKWKWTGPDSVCICMLRISFDTYCGQISSKQIYQTDSRAQSRSSGALTDPTVIHTWPDRVCYIFITHGEGHITRPSHPSTRPELSSESLKRWNKAAQHQELGWFFSFLEKTSSGCVWTPFLPACHRFLAVSD